MTKSAALRESLRSLVQTRSNFDIFSSTDCATNKYGIRAKAIHPGVIQTPMLDQLGTEIGAHDDIIAGMNAATPLGRFGMPSEIADAAVFLASEESSFMTGSEGEFEGFRLLCTRSEPVGG